MSYTVDVPWDGKHISFRIVDDDGKFVDARRRLEFRDICPLCKKRLECGTGVVLMVSNQVGIPNRILHLKCFQDGTPEYVTKRITDDHAKAMEFAHWFPE